MSEYPSSTTKQEVYHSHSEHQMAQTDRHYLCLTKSTWSASTVVHPQAALRTYGKQYTCLAQPQDTSSTHLHSLSQAVAKNTRPKQQTYCTAYGCARNIIVTMLLAKSSSPSYSLSSSRSWESSDSPLAGLACGVDQGVPPGPGMEGDEGSTFLLPHKAPERPTDSVRI